MITHSPEGQRHTLKLVSPPILLPLARCDFSHARKGKRPFQRGLFLDKGHFFPFSRGKKFASGRKSGGSLISVPLALRQFAAPAAPPKKCPIQSRNGLRSLKVDCFETAETVSRLFRSLIWTPRAEGPGDSLETLSGFRALWARETPARGGRGCNTQSPLSLGHCSCKGTSQHKCKICSSEPFLSLRMCLSFLLPLYSSAPEKLPVQY